MYLLSCAGLCLVLSLLLSIIVLGFTLMIYYIFYGILLGHWHYLLTGTVLATGFLYINHLLNKMKVRSW